MSDDGEGNLEYSRVLTNMNPIMIMLSESECELMDKRRRNYLFHSAIVVGKEAASVFGSDTFNTAIQEVIRQHDDGILMRRRCRMERARKRSRAMRRALGLSCWDAANSTIESAAFT